MDGHLSFKPVKNNRDRWVEVPAALSEMISTHLSASVGTEPDAVVSTAPKGGFLTNSSFRRRIWGRAIRVADLDPGLTPHDLRHTAASLMAQATGDLSFVKEQLGHSSVKVTERYSHPYPGSEMEKAAQLDDLYRGSDDPPVGFLWGSATERRDESRAG